MTLYGQFLSFYTVGLSNGLTHDLRLGVYHKESYTHILTYTDRFALAAGKLEFSKRALETCHGADRNGKYGGI